MIARVGPTILLLEDEELIARSVARILKGSVDVYVANTVSAALDALGSHDWHRLLLDIKLPDGNGLDVLATARHLGCDAPALVVTASTDREAINRACALDAQYLVKPFDGTELLAFVTGRDTRRPHARMLMDWTTRYRLTRAEWRVLQAAVTGATHDQIAAEYDIALGTLKVHVKNLLRKTGDRSLVGAAARLLREALRVV